MAKRKTLMQEIHEEVGRDRALNARYQRELTRLQLAHEIAKLRESCHLSQAQLAKRVGTHQSAIARMEQSTYRGHTVATLAKIAAAVGTRLDVRFVASRRRAQHV
jgi:ribosome-binding protein aMBF1 (putative translation factor)